MATPEAKKNKETDTRSTLNKYLADAGVCSRRKAVELIASGKVTIDGHVVTEAGRRIEPGQVVKVGRGIIKQAKKIYIVLNKPASCMSTLSDPQGRRTVMDLIKLPTKERIYHVGRLDYATTGLMILTNDGDLAQRLSHPKYEIKKSYHVTLDRSFEPDDIDELKRGVELKDGTIVADNAFYVGKRARNPVCVELHSGKNRVVRRMFKALGYEVRDLDRVTYAGITKRGLSKGQWRYLTAAEIAFLMRS